MRKDRESGFAILELLLVLIIISVLVGTGVPSLLGSRRQAYDMAVKLALTNAAKAEGALEPASGGYITDLAVLEAALPELDFGEDGSASVNVEVGDVEGGDRGQVLLYARSVTGTWFGIRLVLHGPEAGRHTCTGSRSAMTIDGCTGVVW